MGDMARGARRTNAPSVGESRDDEQDGMDVKRRHVELSSASSMNVVDAIQMAAEAFAIAEGLDEDRSHFLAIALREAAVNAITHGNEGDHQKRVILTFRNDSRGSLLYEVRDFGEGFDPKELPDPLDPENIRKGSGRGVFYMKKFTDRVGFKFPNDGGTVVELEKRLSEEKRLSTRAKRKHK